MDSQSSFKETMRTKVVSSLKAPPAGSLCVVGYGMYYSVGASLTPS